MVKERRDEFMVIAHRGASTYAPENTMAAFDLALEMGARQIELDVRPSRDGHIVVIHDGTVDRTTDGAGPVDQFSLAELQAMDAGSWFGNGFGFQQIPTLDAVFQRYRGKAHFHVEIKGDSDGFARQTADLIHRHRFEDSVTVTTSSFSRLEEIRTHAAELPTAWLLDEISKQLIAHAQSEGDPALPEDALASVLERARSMKFTQLGPIAAGTTPKLVRRLKAEGFAVRCYGARTEELMHRVVESGADGVTINFPDKLIAYLESLNHAWS